MILDDRCAAHAVALMRAMFYDPFQMTVTDQRTLRGTYRVAEHRDLRLSIWVPSVSARHRPEDFAIVQRHSGTSLAEVGACVAQEYADGPLCYRVIQWTRGPNAGEILGAKLISAPYIEHCARIVRAKSAAELLKAYYDDPEDAEIAREVYVAILAEHPLRLTP